MKWTFPLALASLASISVVGCAPQTLSFTGSVSTPTEARGGFGFDPPDEAGGPCVRETDYPDVSLGAQVILRDSSGDTIGLASLGQGALLNGWYPDGIRTPEGYEHSGYVEDLCVYSFRFSDVKSNDDFFSIEVGRRGEVHFSRQQLEESDAFLTIG